jgi:hypothetical protein
MSETVCLYCPAPLLSLEHALPAAFGEFENAPYLRNRICSECNNHRLGVLDEQIARSGPEAFIRRYYGVTGRTTHDSVNPFYRGSAGGQRLEMKVYDPNLGCEILVECTDTVFRQLRQLVFVEQPAKKTHQLPILEGMTPEQLRSAFNTLNVSPPYEMYVVCGNEEREWVHDLVKAASPSVAFGPPIAGATKYDPGAVITFGLTDRYFRGIAKIGFHYFLSQFPECTGHEPQFANIRQYIALDGASGVDSANQFVGERPLPLIGEMLGGARPDGWIGHALCADITSGDCRAHVRLFISADFRPRIYTVRLGGDPMDRIAAASGHGFRYFPDGPHGRFAGETISLTCTRADFPPQPLAPAVAPPTQS